MKKINKYFFLSFCLLALPIAANAQVLDSLLGVLKTAKEDTSKVNALSGAAREMQVLGKFDESLPYIQQGIALGEKLNHNREVALLYRRRGDHYQFISNYPNAIQDFQQSLDIEIKYDRKSKAAVCYGRIAAVHILTGDYAKAISNYQSELTTYEALKDTENIVNALITLWDVHYKKINAIAVASEYLARVNALINAAKGEVLLSSLYSAMGKFYSAEGDIEKGFEYLNKALHLHMKQKDKSQIASDYANIAGVYESTGNYSKLLEYTLKILAIREEQGNKMQIALAYNNVGWGYQLTNNFEKALEAQTKACRLFQESGDEVSIAYPLGNLGIIYNHMGAYELAIEYSQKAMVLFEKTKEIGGVAEAENNIGTAYLNLGNPRKALDYLQKGLQHAKELNEIYEMKNSYAGMSEAYKQLGDYKKAYENHLLFIKSKDTLINQENSDKISRMNFSIENEKKQREIELLNKDAMLTAVELKKQRIVTYSAIAGVTLLLLVFFMFRSYRQKKKVNDQLEKINMEILSQKKEIEKTYNNIKILSEIGQEITSSLDLEKILDTVYEKVNALMDASVFGIGLYYKERNQIEYKLAIENGKRYEPYTRDTTDKNQFPVWCIDNRQPVFINDIDTEYSNYLKNYKEELKVKLEDGSDEQGDPRSMLYLPILLKERVLGIITVQSFKKNAYSSNDLEMLQSLASYIAIALDNYRLYDNMEGEVKIRTAEIEKQKEELEKLSIVASETDNAVIIADAESNIEWVNAGYTRLTGYTLEDLKASKGVNILAVSDNPDIKETLTDCIRNCKTVVYDCISKTKEGKEIWVQTTLTPILGADGKVKKLVAIDSDITKLKMVETEIKMQNAIISEKNKSITDSINYAKKIQDAILPSEEVMHKSLPDSFVLFKPKDIVSGDFYWMEERKNKILFAVVDCTGHGVPGAFVSIVGNNGLYRAVNEFGLIKPSEILDKLNELVEESFSQQSKTSQINDGMDIALCCYDKNTKVLEFAGANNPMYCIKDGVLNEIKGDKQPIGAFDHRKKFTNHSITLTGKESVYIFSDGYADQFGGPSRKKLKYNQFKNLLLSIHQKIMNEQKYILDTSLTTWMGDLEQVDDICVIGVKI